MLKILIIITLIYYLIKGLLYLLLWQTTLKIEEKGKEAKKKAREKRAGRRRTLKEKYGKDQDNKKQQ